MCDKQFGPSFERIARVRTKAVKCLWKASSTRRSKSFRRGSCSYQGGSGSGFQDRRPFYQRRGQQQSFWSQKPPKSFGPKFPPSNTMSKKDLWCPKRTGWGCPRRTEYKHCSRCTDKTSYKSMFPIKECICLSERCWPMLPRQVGWQ